MTAPIPTISPELAKLLRQVKLGQCLDTLPERLALAHTTPLPTPNFLKLVWADKPARGKSTSPGRRAKAAHLDADMTLHRWDPDTNVTYDRATWNELCSLRFVDAGHNALIMGHPESFQQDVGSFEVDGVAAANGGVAEGGGQERLADSDGSHDEGVVAGVDEAQ